MYFFRLDPVAMGWDCLDLVNSLLAEETGSEELEQISLPFSIPGDICLDSTDQNIIVNLEEPSMKQHSQKERRKRGRKKGYRSENTKDENATCAICGAKVGFRPPRLLHNANIGFDCGSSQ